MASSGPSDRPASADDAADDGLDALERVALRLRAAGRHEEAEQILAWRNLHALRRGGQG